MRPTHGWLVLKVASDQVSLAVVDQPLTHLPPIVRVPDGPSRCHKHRRGALAEDRMILLFAIYIVLLYASTGFYLFGALWCTRAVWRAAHRWGWRPALRRNNSGDSLWKPSLLIPPFLDTVTFSLI